MSCAEDRQTSTDNRQRALRGIADLRPGDHLCVIYRDDEEHRIVLSDYLRRGLEAGERVVYIVDARTARQIRGYLRDVGMDVRDAEKRGQLLFLTRDDAYMKEGIFDPQGMISLLREETQRALDEGFSGLRVTGEMTWALRGLPGSERLIEYETLLNEFFPGSPCIGLCQYDARRFPPDILLDVLRTHPIAVVGTRIYANVYYIPPEDLRAGKNDQSTLDRWLLTLEENHRLTAGLRERTRALEERVKELECLRQVRELTSRDDLSVAELLQAVLDPIRLGWRRPERIGVRIEHEGSVYATEGFEESRWRIAAPILRHETQVGMLDVAYPNPLPESEPFLPEERALLHDLSVLLGHALASRHGMERIDHLNRVLRAIRNVNQLIVREHDMGALIQRTCELLTETRGVACALIATLDDEGRPARRAGTGPPEVLAELIAAWSAGTPPHCIGKALASPAPAVIEQPAVACPTCPMATHYGPSAGIAVRLEHAGHVYGVLVAGVPPPFALDDEELDLFKEIAGDLGLALHANLIEKRLHEIGQRYQEVFQRSRDGFVVVDTAGRIVDANPACCDMLGYTLDELRALPDFFAITPERWHDWEQTEIWEKRLLVHGESGVYEKEYIRKGGAVFPVELRSFSVRDETGAIAYLWGIVRDITERKTAEAKTSQLVRKLTVLHRVGQEITHALVDPEQLYATIHRGVAELMPAEAFVISLRVGEDEAEAVYLVDQAGHHPPDRIPRGEGLTWEVLQTEKPVFIPDATRGVPFKARRFGSKKNVGSIIAVPLQTRDRTVGMLSTQSYRPGAFTKEDVQILEMLGSLAAEALENARLVSALRESEARFRRLADNAPDLIYRIRLRPQMRVEYMSPVAARITGYSPEAFYANPGLIVELVHPEDRPRAEGLSRGQVTFGQPVQLRWTHKDGRVIWGEQITIPVRDENGEIVAIEGIARDITDRKRAVEEIQRAEEKYRALVGNLPAIVYTVELGEVNPTTYISPQVETLLGYTPEEWLADPDLWADRIHPEDRERVLAEVRQRDAEGKPLDLEYRVVARDGSVLWFRNVTSIVGSATSVHRSAHGVMYDITSRKRAEDELRESYAKTRRVFDDAVTSLASTIELRDPYTAGHQQRVAELVVALGSELGLPADELDGLRIAGLVHDVGKIVVPAEILSKPGQLSELEMSLVRAHPEAGFDVLRGIEFPWPVAEIVYQHHERLDGSGYPRGLNGDAILFGARILAVADVVEAMSSHRPYRPALGIEAALAEIEAGKGRLYDPQVVDACVKLYREKGFQLVDTVPSPT